MGVATATLLVLKAVAAWIAVQWVLQAVVERVPRVRPVVVVMKGMEEYALVAGTTLCALLVLLPSFVFVVLEVFRYVQVSSRSQPAKSVSDYMERIVGIINELEALGERMRQAALRLNLGEAETMEEKYESVSAPETSILPQTCGNVLLAVCRHSETLERLYSALQPPEVDELIYCDCDDFEIRAEKVISLIGILRECMERQTEVVKTVNDLYPMIPAGPVIPEAPVSCIEDDFDDSGFIED